MRERANRNVGAETVVQTENSRTSTFSQIRHSAASVFRPNRGWFIGLAGMMAGNALPEFDAPLWLTMLTILLSLIVAGLWKWIEAKGNRQKLFWGVAAVYVVVAVVVTAIPKPPAPEVGVIFRYSPLFTESKKVEIVRALDDFRRYLISVGFEVPREVPPIGVSPGIGGSGGTAGAGVYFAHIFIPQEALADPREFMVMAYSYYLFRFLIPDNSQNTEQASIHGGARMIVADYYRASFFGRLSPEYPEDIEKWEKVLWGLRKKFGREVTDKLIFLCVKRWQPFGFNNEGQPDMNGYFARRLLIGLYAMDTNAAIQNELEAGMAKYGVPKPQL